MGGTHAALAADSHRDVVTGLLRATGPFDHLGDRVAMASLTTHEEAALRCSRRPGPAPRRPGPP
jgi:hypothetical protein